MSTPKTPPTKQPAPTPDKDITPARPTGRYQPGRNRLDRKKATFYGRKDNSPVIFGLGRDLPSAHKTRIQQRLYIIFAAVVAVAVVGVLIFGWVNINVIQPNQPIVTVYGNGIAQKNYRYQVAYLAQDNWNQLQADTTQSIAIQAQITNEKDKTKIAALDAQYTALTATISSLQTAFTQTQIDQLAINNLVDDAVIQHGAHAYEASDPKAKAALTVTSKQINDAFTAFKNAFPKGQSLSNFESQDNMSDQNVKDAIAVKLRRTAMDTYQRSLLVSPTKQIHFERIQFNSKSQAQADLTALLKDPTQWNALAKKDSLDVNSRDSGGDLGWAALGQQDQGIEQWLFDPSRKVGDMSKSLIVDISGTYEIVRVLAIDPARPIDSTTLANLQSNALSHWLTGQEDLAPKPATAINQDMYNNTVNIPVTPNLSVTFSPTPTP